MLAEMNIPFLQKPPKTQLKALESELRRLYKAFNRELKQGKLKHLEYDKETQRLTWHKSVVSRNKEQNKRFYEQLPFCDVTDVFRLVATTDKKWVFRKSTGRKSKKISS